MVSWEASTLLRADIPRCREYTLWRGGCCWNAQKKILPALIVWENAPCFPSTICEGPAFWVLLALQSTSELDFSPFGSFLSSQDSFPSSLRLSVSDWRRLAGADFSPLPGTLTLFCCWSHPCIPVSSFASLIARTLAVPCAVFSCHKRQLSESQFNGSWKNNWVVSLCWDYVQTPPSLGYPALAKNVFQGLFSKQRVCCMDLWPAEEDMKWLYTPFH